MWPRSFARGGGLASPAKGLLGRNAMLLAEGVGLAHYLCAAGRWETGHSNERATKRCKQRVVTVLLAAASSLFLSARAEGEPFLSKGGTRKAFMFRHVNPFFTELWVWASRLP